MLILAYLLRRNWEWGRARIRVLREVESEAGRAPAHKALTEMCEAARIDAEVGVVVSTAPFVEILKQYSELATVVFLGFQVPDEEHAEGFFARYEDMLAFTPTTILVNSSGEADLTA